MKKSVLVMIVVVVVIGVGLFLAAQRGQQNKEVNTRQELPQRNTTGVSAGMQEQPRNSGGRPPLPSGAEMIDVPEGSQPIFGTVANFDGSSFTIKSPMGEYRVLLTSSTEYKDGSLSDLKNDIRISGYGTNNDDSIITALQIQINPTMPGGGIPPAR